MNLSPRERKFFNKATVGGYEMEEAFGRVYNHKNKNSRDTSLRRKKKQRPDIFEAIDNYKAELYQNVKEAQEEVIIAEAKQRMLSKIEKRDILARLVLNELKIKENIVFQGKVKKIKRSADFMEILKALHLDNKMAGDYAPTNLHHDAGDSMIELMKGLFTTNNPDIPNT